MVSEIGLGAEWLERHDRAGVEAIVRHCHECGINILDCWMPFPEVIVLHESLDNSLLWSTNKSDTHSVIRLLYFLYSPRN